MIKLIQNELIKIFKRKSIYFLFLLSIIIIFIYNHINPDQHKTFSFEHTTIDIPVFTDEITLSSANNNIKEYISLKESNDFAKLYNSFEENSWQRFALNEERHQIAITDVYTDYNLDIHSYLYNINDYEFNPNSEVSLDLYLSSKARYNEYVNALNSNNWVDFVNLKIKNLEERKNTESLSPNEIEEINFEIELYKLRLDYNINFNYNMKNSYLDEYKSNFYMIQLYNTSPFYETEAFINKNINLYKAKMNLCKYAIENNIEQDISNEITIVSDNKIDARISFIRTFTHFDLIIVIIAIYISSTIVTEEINKRTIKNLLTKPHKRSTILLSKIFTSIIAVIISMIVVIISQYVIGGIVFGFDSYKLNFIGFDYNNEQIFTTNLFNYILLVGLSKLSMYIIIITFCIFIGTLNKHTSMSMILTLIIFLVSSTIIAEWSKVETLSLITRYFVTNNWDFSIYLFGQVSDISGVTIYSSIIICLIHLFILLYLSMHCFNKKEINNV